MIHIKEFPMPPSVNALYANGRHGGRFKTQKYREFEIQAHNWMIKNGHLLSYMREYVKKATESPYEVLQTDIMFFFPATEIWTKAGKPKRNDCRNRLKALDDAIAKILDIDDCYFVAGFIDRTAMPNDLPASVDIEISRIDRPIVTQKSGSMERVAAN